MPLFGWEWGTANRLGVTSEMRGRLFRSSQPLVSLACSAVHQSQVSLILLIALVSFVLMQCLHSRLGNYDAYFLTQPFTHLVL